jgi:DUF438 domain-containing protein
MHLIERLEGEHRDAVAALERLERACARALAGEGARTWSGEREAALRAVCAIVHGHAESEQELVFPALGGEGMDALIATLTSEHAQVRALYERVRALADEGAAPAAWVEPARALRGSLSLHMQRENLLVFPKARRLPAPVLAAWEGR